MTQRSSRRTFTNTMVLPQGIGTWLMATAMLLGVANVQGLDISQHGWSFLEKRAGYYTEDGYWKGGFPKSEHKKGQVFHSCSEVHSSGNFCQKWRREGESAESTRQGTCDCEDHTEFYCKEWNCIGKQTETRCQPEYGKICRFPRTSQGVQNCTCLTPSDNQKYCSSWACTLDMVRKRAVQGEYLCLEGSSQTEYCQQWIGHISSDREEFSILCKCEGKDDKYCRYGNCETRTLLRCNKHKGGWCNLWLSIFVFGGFGLVFLVSGILIVFSDSFVNPGKTSNLIMILLLYICLFVLPWGIGVASSGGLKGLGYVAVLWSGSAVLTAVFLRCQKLEWQLPGCGDFLRWIKIRPSTLPGYERERDTMSQEQAPLLADERRKPSGHTGPETSTGTEEPSQTWTQPAPAIHERNPDTGERLPDSNLPSIHS